MEAMRSWGVPSRRAGQPDMADGPVMPQGGVQERAGLIAELQTARAEVAKLKGECERLAGLATADVIDRYETGFVLRHPRGDTLIIDFDQDTMYLQIDTYHGSERVYLTRAEETQVVLAMIERRRR